MASSSYSGMTLEQASALAGQISGRLPPKTPLMPEGTGEATWHAIALTTGIGGVIWAGIILNRAFRTANAAMKWYNPMTWWFIPK